MNEREKSIFRAGFLAGFMVSQDGWNGEYPFGYRDQDAERDRHFVIAREEAMKEAAKQEEESCR